MQSSEDEVAGSDRSGCTNKLESQVAGIEDAVLVDVDIDSLIGAQVKDVSQRLKAALKRLNQLEGHRRGQTGAIQLAARAVREAHAWLARAIARADELAVAGSPEGHGPVHHFHALWPSR